MKSRIQTTVVFLTMVFLVTSCKSDGGDEVMEPEAETIEGNYNGSWSSTNPLSTYSRLPISAKITATSNPTIFDGEFFFQSGFTPCCGNEKNNGTLKFVVDDKTITEFTYNDILPNCTGTFTGTGVVNTNGSIRIEFTGSDCEGAHTDGVLIFN